MINEYDIFSLASTRVFSTLASYNSCLFSFPELFNNRFASQCSMVKNVPYSIECKTNECLNYFDINENDILSIIKTLNASKPHRWDKISISIIKHS